MEQLTEVQKAARASLHSHFASLKKAASDHAAAAQSHAMSVHGLVDKCMKLAGEPSFEATGKDNAGGQGVSAGPSSASDTTVKVAKTEEEKAAKKARKAAKKAAFMEDIKKMVEGAVKPLSDKVEAIEKAAKTTTVIGDRKDVVETGTKTETKDFATRKAEEEKLNTVAKAAFGGDKAAMDELYKKTVTRGPIAQSFTEGTVQAR